MENALPANPSSSKKWLFHLFLSWSLAGLASYTWLIGDDYQTLRYPYMKYHLAGFLFFALSLMNLKAAMPGEFNVKWVQVWRNLRAKLLNDPRLKTWLFPRKLKRFIGIVLNVSG